FNPNERAVSGDPNRLQRFAQADLAELLAWISLASTRDDLDSGGVATRTSTTDSPMRALVLNGLLFRPAALRLPNAGIAPGAALVVNPDASPNADDSSVKIARSDGVQIGSGALLLTPNFAGSPRIDVVEFSQAPTIVETANRDVFDPSTGLYAPE